MVSAVARPKRQGAAPLAALERRTAMYFAGSLAAHVGMWFLLQQFPDDGTAASIDLAEAQDPTIRTSLPSPEDPSQPKPPDDNGGDSPRGPTDLNQPAMALESGAIGQETAKQLDGRLTVKRTDNDDRPPAITREQAVADARKAGIFSGDMVAMADSISSIASDADYTRGFDNTSSLGPLYGADGSRYGFGVGYDGYGPGGGCTTGGCGAIPGGRYRTSDHGTHAGEGYGGRPGYGVMGRGHSGGPPSGIIGQPTAVGGLDKAIIRRYILRHYEELRYCYERQLLAKPGIEGTVEVQFMIQPTGSVQAGVTGKGFDTTVTSCITDVVATIQFPKPNQGGAVQVNYPFTFRAPGGH
jgi:hypothetical protein